MNVLISFCCFFRLHSLVLGQVQAVAVCVLVLIVPAPPCAAQASAPTSPAIPASALESAPVPASSRPAIARLPKPSPGLTTLSAPFAALDWSSLTPAQKAALKPLAGNWQVLSDPQKRKWISLSANFALMPPDDQAKLHDRMALWAALSPKQREQARLNFAETKTLSPQQKTEQWQAYQALSPEEKQRLAKSMRPSPPRTALAAQPAAPGKLNHLPIKPMAVAPMVMPVASAPLAMPGASAPVLPVSDVPAATQAATQAVSAPEPAASHEAPGKP